MQVVSQLIESRVIENITPWLSRYHTNARTINPCSHLKNPTLITTITWLGVLRFSLFFLFFLFTLTFCPLFWRLAFVTLPFFCFFVFPRWGTSMLFLGLCTSFNLILYLWQNFNLLRRWDRAIRRSCAKICVFRVPFSGCCFIRASIFLKSVSVFQNQC